LIFFVSFYYALFNIIIRRGISVTQRHVLVLVIIIMSIITLKYSGVFSYLSISSMQKYADFIASFVERSYVLSVFGFILFYTFTVLLAIPAFAPLTMVSGYLFGTIPGALYALCGSFIGSIISYIAVKLYLQGYIVQKYHNAIEFFRRYVHRYGVANALLLLHFLTIVPFFLINSFAAISDVPITTFLWTTILGSLPLVFLYSFAGQKLHEIETIADIFSLPIIITFVVLILIALFPMVFRHFNQNKET